jgi:hypothetical protein
MLCHHAINEQRSSGVILTGAKSFDCQSTFVEDLTQATNTIQNYLQRVKEFVALSNINKDDILVKKTVRSNGNQSSFPFCERLITWEQSIPGVTTLSVNTRTVVTLFVIL